MLVVPVFPQHTQCLVMSLTKKVMGFSLCVVYEGDLSGEVVTDNNGRFVLTGLQGSTEISVVEGGWDFETITVSKKTDDALIKGFRKSYLLTIFVEGEGTVEKEEFIVSQELDYYHGASVRLTAIPEVGWSFSHWEGDLEGSKNPVDLFVDGHKTITAVFMTSVSLSVTVDGEGLVEVEPEKQSYP